MRDNSTYSKRDRKDLWRKNQRKHAKVRFRERLHFNMSKKIERQIKTGIFKGRYEELEQQNEYTFRYLIHDIGRKPFQVVYNTYTKEIVTVLYVTFDNNKNRGYNKTNETNDQDN